MYFSLYGDAIFPLLHCIIHSHRPPIGGELDEHEEEENEGGEATENEMIDDVETEDDDEKEGEDETDEE